MNDAPPASYLLRPQPEDPRLTRRMSGLDQEGKPVETALIEQREEIYKRLLEFLSRHLRPTSRGTDTGGVKPAG